MDGGPTVTESETVETAAQERRGSPDRVVAFTDGVFAIVITILVLEITVPPELSDQSLREVIEEVGPSLTAWVISFSITGMYWVWHRDLFGQIRRVNRDVVWLNLLFLLPACLIPFGSSVLGEYHDEAIALHVYGGVLIATSLMRVLLYSYVMRRPELLWQPPSVRNRRIGLYLAAAPIAVYVVAMLVASPAPTLSLVLYFAAPLMYFALVTILRSRSTTRSEADDYS